MLEAGASNSTDNDTQRSLESVNSTPSRSTNEGLIKEGGLELQKRTLFGTPLSSENEDLKSNFVDMPVSNSLGKNHEKSYYS